MIVKNEAHVIASTLENICSYIHFDYWVIVDTGSTMLEILQKVDDRRPAEIRIVTLVHRKGSKHHVDFNAFEIEDEWVVGYGLDDDGLKRNYRNIYKK